VARSDRSLLGRKEWWGMARDAAGRQIGGVGGLTGRGMWHGGGRAPAPVARESGGGGQRSGGVGGRGVGKRGW
jgi:hypothetical protein